MAQHPPTSWRDSAEHRRMLAQAISCVIDGLTNAAGEVTLTASGPTTTTVTDARAGIDSIITFMPKDSAGATELAAGSMYISTRNNGSFVITHSAQGGSPPTFGYMLYGTGRT